MALMQQEKNVHANKSCVCILWAEKLKPGSKALFLQPDLTVGGGV